jgi:DNA adenine methylase
MNTLAPYYGGKANTVGKCISASLPPHRIYVEPCGGMAGVLMQKPRSFVEVYNDIDKNIVNLFKVVRDKRRSKELIRRLRLTPYSRDEFNESYRTYRQESDLIERARKVYVLLSMGFAGSLGNKSWSFGGTKYESSVARTFVNSLKNIEAVCERLREVIIESKDLLKVCKQWDSLDTLIYLDPPYLPETRITTDDYDHEMSIDDHMRILDWCVNEAKGMIIISGYYSQLYADLLESNGWIRVDIQTYCKISRSNGKGFESARTECIWYNQLAYKKQYLPLFNQTQTHK